MDMPPTRYRVVERGRRLEVIDSNAPAVLAPPSAAPGRGTRSLTPKRIAFDGTREWTTHPAYDARAPRRVRLERGGAPMMALRVAMLLLGQLATPTKQRRALRERAADLLDAYSIDAGG